MTAGRPDSVLDGVEAACLIALSGGVDSTAAAFLLQKKGYACTGVTLKLFGSVNKDARDAAGKLKIPFHMYDVEEVFEREVIKPFADGYIKGETPNPCVDCNRAVKFGLLLRYADSLGIAYVATGHYARIEKDYMNNRFLLKKALDAAKDQSYFLYILSRDVLERVLFPLGGLTKKEVRRMAREQGFENAEKPESQDICFAPGGDYTPVIKCRPIPGDVTDAGGNYLGKHKGLIFYTVGQRKGLGLALQKPMYVCAKDAKTNTLILGEEEELYTSSLEAAAFNWISRLPEEGPFRAMVKVRCKQKEQGALITPVDMDKVRVRFDEPQRAIAKGQHAVVYEGDTVVGGGVIV